jgi:hypothetical protein
MKKFKWEDCNPGESEHKGKAQSQKTKNKNKKFSVKCNKT